MSFVYTLCSLANRTTQGVYIKKPLYIKGLRVFGKLQNFDFWSILRKGGKTQ